MNRREFLARLGAACLLGTQVGISGCIGSAVSNNSRNESATDTVKPTVANTQSTSLAGTCPRGRSCMSPQCQLWSDENSNSRCDRGTQGE